MTLDFLSRNRSRAANQKDVERPTPTPGEPLADLAVVYREHHGFVWRSLLHLGLPQASVDDALQDVFLVVHRRIGHFDGRTSVRNWLYGITRRVASEYRRGTRRAVRTLEVVRDPDAHPAPGTLAGRISAADTVHKFLDTLDDDKREVFVLAEVEGMTAVEIAEALQINVNTIYGRLRAARQRFARAMQRERARDARQERER